MNVLRVGDLTRSAIPFSCSIIAALALKPQLSRLARPSALTLGPVNTCFALHIAARKGVRARRIYFNFDASILSRKNFSTSPSWRVRFIGGRLCQIFLP